MILTLFAASLLQAPQTTAETQREAPKRDASTRPFAIEQTSARFTPLPDGGTVELVSGRRNPARIRRARERLRAEAASFAGGDYRTPEAAGEAAAQLAAGADRIDVAYADTPDGGRIRFITSDPALVQALHAWLAAQVRGGR